jgi:aminoglycoside 6'-N-acetyltransferase
MAAVSEMLGVRPLVRADLPRLADWLGQPHVHRWWDHDPTEVDADFGVTLDGDRPTELYVVELDGRPIGMIQRYRIADYPEWRDALTMIDVPDDALGIDYLIGEAGLTNRGIGTALIRVFVDKAWAEMPDAPAIIVDVDPENRPSWRVLERAGFRRVWSGEMTEPGETDPGSVVIYRLDRPG